MLIYEHGNRDGTGSRLVVDIVQSPDDGQESVVFTIEPQTECGADGDEHPQFDADAGVSISLDAKRMAHVLMVVDGTARDILGGKGLRVKRKPSGMDILHVDWTDRPFDGYAIHIKRVDPNAGTSDVRIMLNLTEGAALRDALRSSMGRIAFGK